MAFSADGLRVVTGGHDAAVAFCATGPGRTPLPARPVPLDADEAVEPDVDIPDALDEPLLVRGLFPHLPPCTEQQPENSNQRGLQDSPFAW